METIREFTFEIEKKTLSEYASFSEHSRGRDTEDSPCEIRTPYQRDRDRIIHSKAFRRLMHKTQCFLSPEGDHYRTRLTHTLEVAQIARTLARSLRLNEDLTEAASLGHDLGHTPFGHAGERMLADLCPGGFSHNEQSLRVVELLENDGKGLNLTFEVRNGILCHTGKTSAITLEGGLIGYADKIAYINHDIDDAVRGGILKNSDIPKDLRKKLGETHGERIDVMVKSLISATKENFENGIAELKMEDSVFDATMKLREFLFENIYFNPIAKSEESKACDMLESLYTFFVKNADKMPFEYKKYIDKASVERVVCDYIAGMTDRYAVQTFETLFVPKMWGK